MSRKAPVRSARYASADAAARFMQSLKDDHVGLSRVLREIDAQVCLLQSTPETARSILAEAMRYLLIFQHAVHHPREDSLFDRIRAREPGLYRNMRHLVREHRSGQQRTEQLAAEIRQASLAELRGRTGLRIAREVQEYVRRTRAHMRQEEAVFYSGSERVLRASDWIALMKPPLQRDPARDLHRLAARYPRLAARLAEPERMVTGVGERVIDVGANDGLGQRAERAAERLAEILHDAVDIARSGMQDLRKVRSPTGLARAYLDAGARGCRLAARLVALSFNR